MGWDLVKYEDGEKRGKVGRRKGRRGFAGRDQGR